MNDNKKKELSLILTIIALLLLVVGATYAYFAAQTDGTAQTNVDITAESVDSLTFSTGEAINISATLDNFGEGKGNRVGTTSATASLIAGKDSNASYNYYVYLDIEENSFKYTTSEKEAELILKVTGPNGEVTSIPGLTYNETLGGFDITEESGILKIAENKEIATTSTKTEEWKIEVTFINLSTNQTGNNGATLKSSVKIQREKEVTLAEHIISTYGSDPTLYYHDENLENGANDNSYRYSGGDGYFILSEYQSLYSKIDDELIKQYCNGNLKNISESCNARYTQYFVLDYDEKQTNYISYYEALYQAIEDKYVNRTLNNFVCFGSAETVCLSDNLYRIIGVFNNQVKLIKYDFATDDLLGEVTSFKTELGKRNSAIKKNYKGNNKYSYTYTYYPEESQRNDILDKYGKTNIWQYSELNTKILNTNYLNNIGAYWKNKIYDSIWYVGGMNTSIGFSNAKTVYENEVGKNKILDLVYAQPYKAKIGLMYVSDYMYAASPSFWNLSGYTTESYPDANENYGAEYDYRSAINDNWLFSGLLDTTISPIIDDNYLVFNIEYDGRVLENYGQNIRPVFYLKENIKYNSGTGTQTDPYRIA